MTEIEKVLSPTRLAAYEGGTLAEQLSCYRWNVQLCQALYPSLHYLEITLRNRIHAAFTALHGEWWFDNKSFVSHPYAREQIENVYDKLKGTPIPGDIVAAVSFGFWKGFFDKDYEDTWRLVLYDVFPHVPSEHASRKGLAARVDEIRRLRNRVFHHEPVFRSDPAGRHQRAQEMLGWISPAALAQLQAIDPFSATYTADPRTPLPTKASAT